MNAIAKRSPKLADLEKVIDDGLRSWVEIAHALLEIRDRKLYEPKFETFDAYCLQRWNFKKARASQLISAASVVDRVYQGKLPPPENEKQARELARLPAEEQPKAWEEAVNSAPEGVVTAKHVAEVVTKRLPKKAPPATSKAKLSDVTADDVAAARAAHVKAAPRLRTPSTSAAPDNQSGDHWSTRLDSRTKPAAWACRMGKPSSPAPARAAGGAS